MALSTYTELQAALAAFGIRTDQTANWPDLIRLAEAKIERELRARQMTIRADASLDDEFEDLPSDFAEVVSFRLMTTPVRTMRSLEPAQMAQIAANGASSGNPQYYSIVGPQFRFWPVPADAVAAELTYFQRLPPLSENAQNWLLYRHPDVYLFGALAQYAKFFGDDRLPAFEASFNEAIGSIKRSDHAMGETLAPVPTYSF